MKPIRSLSMLALVVPLVAGCGGGGGGGDPTPAPTLSIPSTASLDGGVFSDGRALPDIYPQPGHGPSGNPVQRGIYHFDLSTLPAGAQVLSAELRAEQFLGTSGDPYEDMGSLVVDHIDMTGVAFDGTLFSGHTITNGIGVLSTSRTYGVKTLDVATQVRADVAAGRSSSSFRLHFQNETGTFDINNRSVFFNDGERHYVVGQIPVLVVTYQ